MTPSLFTEWLNAWNAELNQADRKALSLVDNCSAHPLLTDLSKITLRFLPPNTTALTQPMDMGIIKNLKTRYCSELVKHILHLLENEMPTLSTALQVGAKVNILMVIQMVTDSWRNVPAATLRNCFAKCGFTSLETPDRGEAEVNVGRLPGSLKLWFIHHDG